MFLLVGCIPNDETGPGNGGEIGDILALVANDLVIFVNVSNPENPVEISRLGAEAFEIVVYVGYNGLVIINASNLYNLSTVGVSRF